MKILQLSAVKNWGGGENQIEALCTELKKSNPEVENIIFCVRNGKFHEKIKNKDLSLITAALSIKMDFRFVLKLISTCMKEKIDLIHIHDPSALTLAVMADKFYDLPPFIFSKKTSFPIKKRKQTRYKYNYQKIKKILCVSEETKKITAEGIKDHQKLETIYHGTRLDNKSDKTPFSLRQKLNIPAGKKIIGTIGNHIRAKHLETFIEVVNDIVNKEKRQDFFFVQIGGITKRTAALKERIAALNLQEHIAVLGFIPEASNFIPQFDISLITSQSEGVPGVIYESFYHEVPVVSTNVGGIPEIIEDGKNGLLANKHDHKKLSEHILYLTDNPQLISGFTQLSKNKLLENFTTDIMAQKTLSQYKQIINGRF